MRPESQFPDTVHFGGWEGGTQDPILYLALNKKSLWIHPGKGKDTALFTSQPFAEYRHYDLRVMSASATSPRSAAR